MDRYPKYMAADGYIWSPIVSPVLQILMPIFEVLHISNLAHMVFNLGCAFSPTSGSLIAFRFLCRHFS
jgi:hypothetical protein